MARLNHWTKNILFFVTTFSLAGPAQAQASTQEDPYKLQNLSICNGKLEQAVHGQFYQLPQFLSIIPDVKISTGNHTKHSRKVQFTPQSDTLIAFHDNQAFQCKLPEKPLFQRGNIKYFFLEIKIGNSRQQLTFSRHSSDPGDISIFPYVEEMAFSNQMNATQVDCDSADAQTSETKLVASIKAKLSQISKKFRKDRSFTRALLGPEEHESNFYEALLACRKHNDLAQLVENQLRQMPISRSARTNFKRAPANN